MYVNINKNVIVPNPLNGYKRITNDNKNIEYIGDIKSEYTRSYAYNGCVHFTNDNNSMIRFSIYSKKFILINPLYYDGTKINIKVDNIDYLVNDANNCNTGITNIFEIEFENIGYHDIIISKYENTGWYEYLYFDSIDIDENGSIVPFLKNRYIITSNNVLYYIKNNEITIINDKFKKDVFYNNSCGIGNYNKEVCNILKNSYNIIKI